jgi:vacuolar-type H+-ATPase subunit I/STV1
MTINIALALGLIASLVINFFTFWYVRQLLGRLRWISENINDLTQIIKIYQNNLQDVQQLEQFYGDKEIRNLVLHTASLLDVLDDYGEVTLITEPIEYEDEPETQQQEEQNAEKEVQEKHVLYAGTRERNN